MDKKIHCNFAIEGQDVDKMDIYRLLLEEIQSKGMDAKIASGSFQCYYTETTPKPEVIKKKEKK